MAGEPSTRSCSSNFDGLNFHESAAKWFSFTKSQPVITLEESLSASPLQSYSVNNDARNKVYQSMMSNGMAFVLEVTRIVNWPIPKALVNSNSGDKVMDLQIQFSLSMSFFHLPSRRFFGSTWMGPGQLNADFLSREVLCFWSRIVHDPDCYIVIEFVAAVVPNEDDIDGGPQYSCGFSLIQPYLNTTDRLETFDICEGTPKDLLSDDGSKMNMNLTKISGSKIQCKLISHEKLTKILPDFVRENEIVSACNQVIGLHIITNDGPEKVDVRITKSQVLRFEHLNVNIPFRSKFESHLIEFVLDKRMQPQRSRLWSMVSAMCPLVARSENQRNNAEQGIVTRRVLKIAIHNGYSIRSSKWYEFELVIDEENESNLIPIIGENCEVDGFIKHELCAVIFVLEYTVRAVQTKNNQNVVVGVQAFVPFLATHDEVDISLCSPPTELYRFLNSQFEDSITFLGDNNDERDNEYYNKLSFHLSCYTREFESSSGIFCVKSNVSIDSGRFGMSTDTEAFCGSFNPNNEKSVLKRKMSDQSREEKLGINDESLDCVGSDYSYNDDHDVDCCGIANDTLLDIDEDFTSNETNPSPIRDTSLILPTHQNQDVIGETLRDRSVPPIPKNILVESRQNPPPLPNKLSYAKRLTLSNRFCEEAKSSERFANVERARTEWKEKALNSVFLGPKKA